MGAPATTPQLLAHWSDRQPDQQARIEVETDCEGALAHLGHRLRLAVGRYRITLADRQVHASLVSASLHPVGILRGNGVCHVDIPSGRDRERISQTVRGRILQADRFPSIDFGGDIRAIDDHTARLEGSLTLAGQRRPISLDVALQAEAAIIEIAITPSRWGIRPYSTLAGQLRVADRVLIRVVASLARLRGHEGLDVLRTLPALGDHA